MIYGEIAQFRGDFCNCPAVKKAMAFLADTAPGAEDGRHDLGDGMFVDIKQYSPAPAAGRRYETHIKYIDVQAVLEGAEVMYVTKLNDFMLQNITEDRMEKSDVRFHANPEGVSEVGLKMRPGWFALLMPDDAHKPECADGVAAGRKAIVKIPVELVKF